MEDKELILAAIKLLKRQQSKLLKSLGIINPNRLHANNYAYYHGLGTAILYLQVLKRRS